MLSPNPNSRPSGTLPPESWQRIEELYLAALSQIGAIHLTWPFSSSSTPQEKRQHAQLACAYLKQGLRVALALSAQGVLVSDAQKAIEHYTSLLNRAEKTFAVFAASSDKAP